MSRSRDVRRREFDLGLGLAVLTALATTFFVASITYTVMVQTETDCSYCDFDPVFFAFGVSAVTGAWLGAWAWRKRRWLLGALGFLLSLASPIGYLIELTAPFAFGLMIVSLIRAWKDRRRTVKPRLKPGP